MSDSTPRFWDYEVCSRQLAGERHRRDTLKLLLKKAKLDQAPLWTSTIAGLLAESRKRINRLSARKSRLAHCSNLGIWQQRSLVR